MRKELILSNLRIELRRKQASYLSEKRAISVVEDFLESMSIVHSSQIRNWQKDFFLSNIERNRDKTKEDLLQARSALAFLYSVVLNKGRGIDFSTYLDRDESGHEVFRITG